MQRSCSPIGQQTFSLPLTIAFGVLCASGAALMIATGRAVEFVRFHKKEHRETVLLDIARVGPDSANFDEFIARMIRAVDTNKYRNGDWVMMVTKEPRV